MPPRNQGEMDTSFHERPANSFPQFSPLEKRQPPRNQEEIDKLFRLWDDRALSHAEQNELTRLYGFDEKPACRGGRDGPRGQQQSRLSFAEDACRKTRGGRITKNAPQRQSGSRRGTRSRQSAPTRAEALPPARRRSPSTPEVLEELGDDTLTAPQHCRRQRKTYRKERASRRLAGELPEQDEQFRPSQQQAVEEASSREGGDAPRDFEV
ncbi:hypothetical protein DL768_001845 [Monosporascus sp. mg162]|nr:hypothetical protein DL768_001845 [Monosporascus sp. mg162]